MKPVAMPVADLMKDEVTALYPPRRREWETPSDHLRCTARSRDDKQCSRAEGHDGLHVQYNWTGHNCTGPLFYWVRGDW